MAARAKYNVHFWNHKKSFVLSRLNWLKFSSSEACFCFGCHYLVWHPCQGNLFLTSTVVFLLLLQLWKWRQDSDAAYLNENWFPGHLWFWWREQGSTGSWWLARTCKADRCVPCLLNNLENQVLLVWSKGLQVSWQHLHAITIDTIYNNQPKAKKLIALPEIKDYVCYACEYQRKKFSILILMAKVCTG